MEVAGKNLWNGKFLEFLGDWRNLINQGIFGFTKRYRQEILKSAQIMQLFMRKNVLAWEFCELSSFQAWYGKKLKSQEKNSRNNSFEFHYLFFGNWKVICYSFMVICFTSFGSVSDVRCVFLLAIDKNVFGFNGNDPFYWENIRKRWGVAVFKKLLLFSWVLT